MVMDKLLKSKQRIEEINQGCTGNHPVPSDSKKKSRRPKFEHRHQRVTIYLLNLLYDEFMELRDQGYKQTDLMNEAISNLIQKYTNK